MKILILFFSICFGLCNLLQAQTVIPSFDKNILQKNNIDSSSKLRISEIDVTGNRKTKTYIILREVQLKIGDSLIAGDLYKNIIAAKQQVYNTSLFTEVQVTPEFTAQGELKLVVAVKEKWYIFPTPQFQLVDRNFNEWIKTYNASLNRVIYGAKFLDYNLSGRADQLRIYLLNGYARNIIFSYINPASNPKLTEGFGVNAAYSQNREISYKTSFQNKLLQYRNDNNFIRNVFNIGGAYIVRKGLFKRHSYTASYSYFNANDSLISTAYNPSYFNTGRSAAGFIDLSYFYQYIKTNNNNYPLSGRVFNTTLLKRGFGFTGGINMLSVESIFNNYFAFNHNWYASVELSGKLKLPFRQPYINQQALGYKDFYVRGLEYYVVDGVAATVAKFTLKKKIVSFNIPVPFHIRTVPKLPFNIYAKIFTDEGYSYNKPDINTRLNNRFLYSSGFGIDVLTLYDLNLRIEYSFNQLGENGLFLHARGGF